MRCRRIRRRRVCRLSAAGRCSACVVAALVPQRALAGCVQHRLVAGRSSSPPCRRTRTRRWCSAKGSSCSTHFPLESDFLCLRLLRCECAPARRVTAIGWQLPIWCVHAKPRLGLRSLRISASTSCFFSSVASCSLCVFLPNCLSVCLSGVWIPCKFCDVQWMQYCEPKGPPCGISI